MDQQMDHQWEPYRAKLVKLGRMDPAEIAEVECDHKL